MSEDIKELLETLVLMERNNLDHLIRTGQAIKWRKGIEQLQQENKELKKQVEIKNSGFMASIEEVCEYATVLIEFEKWLEEEINNKKIHYDEPLSGIPMTIIDTLKVCLDKLQKLKEGNNEI